MHKYLTEDLPGIGGVIKESPGDFLVCEIPLYLPCGEGEHTYAEIEKTGITTLEAIRRMARFVQIPEKEVGYAGMKDAGGITRQMISIPRVAPELILNAEIPGIRVLSAVRHRNKLKLGHLAGNRFRIRVCNPGENSLERAQVILEVLRRRGVPNYFGPQRYGAQGNYPAVGKAILMGDFKGAIDAIMGSPDAVQDERWKEAIAAYHRGDLKGSLAGLPVFCRTERDILLRLVKQPQAFDKATYAVNPRLRKLYLSAYQSSLFDRVLEERLGGFDRIVDGDLAYKHANGACFLVVDALAEADRAEQFEISASGPLFGCKMKLPQGLPLELEDRVLKEEGIALDQFDLPGGLRMEGERRPLRIQLGDPLVAMEDSALVLEFSLPRGTYATSVLREIMKNTGGNFIS
ncbi:MAG TPA: tRNA pseudouridine(13) synthase TruD [Geobacteraceae bacterium]|nr:tRNA pseudouridine(13) synthase TruD [Geobacteraceae bacterium]